MLCKMPMSAELARTTLSVDKYTDPQFSSEIETRMLRAARHAAHTRAVSYRDFKVGACAAVYLPGLGGVTLLEAGNYSPYKGSPKRCAEMSIVQQTGELATVHDSRAEMLAMYIAGPDNPALIKEVTGLGTLTLHSCADCRAILQHHPAAAESMELVTAGLKPDAPVERHTLGSMLALYGDVQPPQNSAQLLAAQAGVQFAGETACHSA